MQSSMRAMKVFSKETLVLVLFASILIVSTIGIGAFVSQAASSPQTPPQAALPPVQGGIGQSTSSFIIPAVTSMQNPPSLTDFWSGSAYFERSHYTTSSNGGDDFQELAPIVNPNGDNPNLVWVYYRHNTGDGHGEIFRSSSTNGGLTYTQDNGGNPVLCPGNAKWSQNSACPGSDVCQWDAQNVIMPSVAKVGSTFFMVYEGDSILSLWVACSSSHYMTVGDIGLATSTDGIAWTKLNGNGLFLTHDQNSDWQCNNIGGPSVSYLNDEFYVFFHGNCGAQTPAVTAALCTALGLPAIICDNGGTACVPILNSNGSPNINSSCPYGFRFDNLRNKAGMVHASGTDLTQLQTPLENQILGIGQATELPPIMDIGIGAQSWDSRVNGRPNVIYDGSYYYLFFEGAQYAWLKTYDGSLPIIGNQGVNEGNWGWGVARSTDINGPWQKYPYNPIRQDFQNSNSGLFQQPYVFQVNGVTWVYMWHPGAAGQSSVLVWGTDPYLHDYPAVNHGNGQCEQPTLHHLGYIDGTGDQIGWAQSTGVNNDYLCFGPYQPISNPNDYSQALWKTWTPGAGKIPAGNYAVTFRSMIDSLDCSGDFPPGVCAPIVTYDITHNSGNVRDSIFVPHRNDYQAKYQYQNFEQQFTATVANSPYEWRTFFDSHAYTRENSTFLRQIDGTYDTTTPSASMNPLPSNSGLPLTVSWSGSANQVAIWSYDVQVNDNGQGWGNWLQGIQTTSYTVAGAACFHTYQFQVRARDFAGNVGGYSGPVTTYVACDFNVTANPTTVPVIAGAQGTSTITVTPLDGYSDPVSLNVDNPACSLSPVTVSASGTSTLSCIFSTGGNYVATVTGSGDGLTHSLPITFNVQDFTMTPTPSSFTLSSGSGTSTINIAAVNSFSGTITLTYTVTGVSCGTNCPTITFSPNPVTLTGSTASTVLTVQTTSSTPLGTYTLFLTGTSGSISRPATLTFTVIPDFTISASLPNALYVNAGAPSTSTITLTSLGGFTSSITLTGQTNCSSNCPTLSFSPATLSPTAGGTVQSVLTITTSFTTAQAAYTVTITSASGTLSHTFTIPFIVDLVYNNDFTGSLSSSWQLCPGSQIAYGIAGSSLQMTNPGIFPVGGGLCYYGASGLNGWTIVSRGEWNAGTNPGIAMAVYVSNANFTLVYNGSNQHYEVYLAGNLIHSTNAPTLFSNSWHDLGVALHAGLLTFSIDGQVAFQLSWGGFLGWVELMPVGSSTDSFDYIAIAQSDPTALYSLTAFQNPLTTTAGTTVSSLIYVSEDPVPQISLASSVSGGAGLTCTLSPTSVTGSGGIPTSTLSCSGTAGAYLVTVTGTSGSQSQSTIILVTVQDFTISTSPGSVTVFAGSTGTLTINLNSLDGFSGTVSLTSSVSPTGPICNPNPSSVALSSSTTSTLTCTQTTGGAYLVTVTATSGSLIRSATSWLYVSDFTISATPASATVNVGSTTSSTVTVQTNAQWPCCSVISLTAAGGSTYGMGFIFSQQPNMGPGQTAQATLTISANLYAAPGVYPITVYGYSNGVQRTTSITLTIEDFSLSESVSAVTVQDFKPTSLTVTASSQDSFAGTVTWSATNLPSCATAQFAPSSLSLSSGSSLTSTLSLTFSGCTAFSGQVYVQGIGATNTHTVSFTLNLADFGITVFPSNLGVYGTGTAGVTGYSFGGFTGSISLTATGVPTCGAVGGVSFSPPTITLASGSTASSSMTLSNIYPGYKKCSSSYQITIQGSDGTITRTAVLNLGIAGNILSASPNPTVGIPGTMTQTIINVSPVVGITDTLTMSVSTTSSTLTNCATLKIGPSTINEPAGGTAIVNATLSSSCQTGTYPVTVTATGVNELQNSITFNIAIYSNDFTIILYPTSITVPQGYAYNLQLSVISVNGFSGPVQLTLTFPPGIWWQGWFPPTMTLTPGGSNFTYWDLAPGINQPLATYTAIMTATGGSPSRTHIVTLTVTVTTPPSCSPNCGGGGGCSPTPQPALTGGGPHPCTGQPPSNHKNPKNSSPTITSPSTSPGSTIATDATNSSPSSKIDT